MKKSKNHWNIQIPVYINLCMHFMINSLKKKIIKFVKYTDGYHFVHALNDKLDWNNGEHKILMFAVSYADNKAKAPWDRECSVFSDASQ